MSKGYCFVDESGLTNEPLFVVAVIVVPDADKARDAVLAIARATGKRGKWAKTNRTTRAAYAERLIAAPELVGSMFCAVYDKPGDYLPRLLRGIAAVLKAQPAVDSFVVYIDALPVTLLIEGKNNLRDQGLRIDAVRTCTDDNEPLVMVADALAGLLRASRDGTQPFKTIFSRALASGKIVLIALE